VNSHLSSYCVWSLVSLFPSEGREGAREAGRNPTQVCSCWNDLPHHLNSNKLHKQPRCGMDEAGADADQPVSLTNTCRGLIKLHLELFSSCSLTQICFRKG